MYPYPRSFRFDGHEVPFAYERQLGGKLVFEAHVTAGTHGLETGLHIIVKFTDTYCVDAHNLCYECDGSAPRLYSHSRLPGRTLSRDSSLILWRISSSRWWTA